MQGSAKTLLMKKRDANMNTRSPHAGNLAQTPTCENCVHTIRKNGSQDIVVCVQHLKDIPVKNSPVCELHSIRGKSKIER